MIRLNSISSEFIVPSRDKNPTEFEVHAQLFSRLKSLGVDVRGEITYTDIHTNERYRFDLVIYKNGKAIELIEVKSHPVKHKTTLENTRQAKKYRRFGIDVCFVYGLNDVDEYINPFAFL